MRKSFMLLMVLIIAFSDLVFAGERLKFGGNGNAWDETGLYLNALEVTGSEGLLSELERMIPAELLLHEDLTEITNKIIK